MKKPSDVRGKPQQAEQREKQGRDEERPGRRDDFHQRQPGLAQDRAAAVFRTARLEMVEGVFQGQDWGENESNYAE